MDVTGVTEVNAASVRIMGEWLIFKRENGDVRYTKIGPFKRGVPPFSHFELVALESYPCTFGNPARN